MGESILGCMGKYSFYLPVDCMAVPPDTAHLPSFYADNLKYAHTNALRYNKCRFGFASEAALMTKERERKERVA